MVRLRSCSCQFETAALKGDIEIVPLQSDLRDPFPGIQSAEFPAFVIHVPLADKPMAQSRSAAVKFKSETVAERSRIKFNLSVKID